MKIWYLFAIVSPFLWMNTVGAGHLMPVDRMLEFDISNPEATAQMKASGYDIKVDREDLEADDLSNPYRVVNMFVDFEFKGFDRTRFYLERFTQEEPKNKTILDAYEDCDKIDNEDCVGPLVPLIHDQSANFDPIFIVSGYTILSINIDGEHGTATIDYDRLATAERGKGQRRMTVDRKDHDLVTLNLRKEADRWYVVDPPPWRISVDAYPQNCQNSIRGEGDEIDRNPGRPQPYQDAEDCVVLQYVSANRRNKGDLRVLLGDTFAAPMPVATPGANTGDATYSAPATVAPTNDLSDPRQVLMAFISGEYRGDRHLRPRLVEPAPTGASIPPRTERLCRHAWCSMHTLAPRLPEQPLDPLQDEWFAVASFRIQNVKVEGDHAQAEVDFDRLLATHRFGSVRRIFADEIRHEQVTYHLMRRDQQWRIVDPPPPRIALDRLVRAYRFLEHASAFSVPRSSVPDSPLYSWLEELYVLRFFQTNPFAHDFFEQAKNRLTGNLPGNSAWFDESRELANQRRRIEAGRIAWEQSATHTPDTATPTPAALAPPTPPEGWEASKEHPGSWRDPATGMTFVWIPGGTFAMGCAAWVDDCFIDETPVHRVSLDGYWLSAYPVTQAQWRAVMGYNPSLVQERLADHVILQWHSKIDWEAWQSAIKRHPEAFADVADHPVEQVTWERAQTFIKKLNKLHGLGLRLPTEAEWEYACREGGEAGRVFPDHNPGDKMYERSTNNFTFPVDTGGPNRLGVSGMVGNVREWVQDRFLKEGYRQHASYNPLVAGRGKMVTRGGEFLYTSNRTQPCFHRDRQLASKIEAYTRVGFRLARSR
ncbi:MAG: SUMF1/EgtB/PvdO family nonheme iron enzyme [Magnetococcales bacterium]|nr:SUMF1/EgtB/PvdO family nonheme iron enzyme [Magnetococcales bacterium]